MKKVLVMIVFAAAVAAMQAADASAARIKDIAGIGGVRDNQLVGFGLVVGLAGTGDDVKNGFTRETLSNMLSRQGINMKEKTSMKADNVAAVMITAKLPPFAKIGRKIDVEVSSIGDAKSLSGGTLIMTPLRGADGNIYAVAQGPIALGGFSAGGAAGGGVSKNHATAGYIANGALVEKELVYDFEKNRDLSVTLFQPDFTTAARLSALINTQIKEVEARLEDSGTVIVNLRDSYKGSVVELVSRMEGLDVPVDSRAIVVMNEKTGTIVMGENVRISTVAVAHGNLSIEIKEDKKVSQPLPFAPAAPAGEARPHQGRGPNSGVMVGAGGQTVITPETQVAVQEEKKNMLLVPQGVTIQDVVRALNAIGATPRDLITILQTIKAAGALQADLRIM
jgi:flagellar P-ring protein precursor FlgI